MTQAADCSAQRLVLSVSGQIAQHAAPPGGDHATTSRCPQRPRSRLTRPVSPGPRCSRQENLTLILIPCPERGLPAEVTDRFTLPGTDGPVGHLALRCSARHHLRMPTDLLPAGSREWLQAQQSPAAPVSDGDPIAVLIKGGDRPCG